MGESMSPAQSCVWPGSEAEITALCKCIADSGQRESAAAGPNMRNTGARLGPGRVDTRAVVLKDRKLQGLRHPLIRYMVKTTRNSALPLSIRAYAAPAFSSG